ncbi:MFS transporter [Labrys wisconsinensis]|uniref:EmrB/QacA subfamily drug resistance transporter n=1 Tax=Labrys wisconsinensis TaxID=425677 RepID=A0ABU0JLF8_9HYPH|nr:MFS transporter [Labrys wisconsinensis]MDQ0475120.1 EmrB/QacA subfamily drug resistance transporter [Labrys wisconsinensis]
MTAPASRSTAVALLVAGAFFMENLDGTVIVTALPEMARSFGVHPIDLNIGISAYVLTLAVLIPASGWAADRFGARRVFAGAVVVFTVASMLCGLSGDLTTFTLARILQGAGGALMVPVGRLAVLRSTGKHELVRAIATITWPGLAAPVVGPPLGGFITTYASWHWIFFLNLPLGLIAFVLALRLIPDTERGRPVPFDPLGFILTGLACSAVMAGLDLVGRSTGWPLAGLCLLVGVGTGAAATLHARRRPHPLVDLRALSLRSYAVTIWGGSLFRIAIAAIPFLLPLMFQLGFGLDAFRSGLLVLAVFAGNLAMKPLTTAVLHRFSFRAILLWNGLLNAAAIFACALLTPATPVAVVAALLFVSGLTRSMQFTALNTLAFADVPEAWMSGANTLFNMAQQMAMGMGIAAGAVALRAAGWFVPGAPAVPLGSFHLAFLMTGMIALAGCLDLLGLERTAGDAVRARRAAQGSAG